MMAIVQKKMDVQRSIYEMLQLVSVSLTDTVELKTLFCKPNCNIVMVLPNLLCFNCNNPSAIHCYEAAGFHRVFLQETESYECLGERWNCIEMERYSDVVIREIKSHEIPLLTDFLYEAIFQPDNKSKIPRTVLQKPMIWAYVDRFGTRPEDFCLL